MIYSPTRHVLFTHVSRTGGVVLTDALQRALPDAQRLLDQHAPLAEARTVLGADRFSASFKFAIVRNPWDRLMSWYALIGKLEHNGGPAMLLDPASAHWKGFDAFLEKWSAEEVRIDGVRRRKLSQWAQLADAEGHLLIDDVGRFETLAEDAARLFARMGLDRPPLPKMNTAPHHHYSLYYSDFGRELVAHAFREDAERFDYRFEP